MHWRTERNRKEMKRRLESLDTQRGKIERLKGCNEGIPNCNANAETYYC